MSISSEPDDGTDDLEPDEAPGIYPLGLDDETPLDHTRAEYTGVVLDDEFQPVDEVELAEEGALLDDPERLADEEDGVFRRRPSLDPDDIGWDLDADR